MNLSSFPPKVFLIGAQKAGTTQLADYLAQHPDICMAAPKEPDYFTQHWHKDLTWYKNLFAKPNKILLDASTSYSCAPLPDYFRGDGELKSAYSGIPERIHSISPDARFIYIMRDPVQRTYSAYLHQYRAGIQTNSFADSLAADTLYMRTSHYAGQLELYLKYFPLSQFKFVFFEELVNAPHQVVRDCFSFLELNPDVLLNDKVSQNKSFVYKGKWRELNKFFGKTGGISQAIKKIKPYIPNWFIDKLTDSIITRPEPMPEKEKKQLTIFFSNTNSRLKILTKIKRLPWE